MHRWVRRLPQYNHTRKRLVSTRCSNLASSSSGERFDKSRLLKYEVADLYPRFKADPLTVSCRKFVSEYRDWAGSESCAQTDVRTIHGRVRNIRHAGSKLIFLDVVGDDTKVQGVCSAKGLAGIGMDQFKSYFQDLQRGDIIKLTGAFYKTSSNEPSLKLNRLPELLSPCLHPLPERLLDQEVKAGKRHLGYLVDSKIAGFVRAKSTIVQGIRQFLLDDQHIEVQTPILATAAGGAIARPFLTTATEFMDRNLSLRIAPELWLKRMVVGGFDRVFEIGPSFRNEGIDSTHNPEFMTCEFYRAYTDLEGLMVITERMFDKAYKSLKSGTGSVGRFSGPYKRIDFITGIEAAIGSQLPELSSPLALEQLKELISKLSLDINTESIANTSQLLDKLCDRYLERFCEEPTFITGHPECMSPLSKSFTHPERPHQRIAARAELFVKGQELANMYEEENSPTEQRRKFVEQATQKGEVGAEIDEAYLEALEWGLPPVGGWGCGIERLTMAMTGATRISDVLSFGTLRNVISRHNKR